MKKLILILSLCCSLQGCIFVAGAAAGAAAVTVVYDHRKLAKILTDQELTKKISDKFSASREFREKNHIEVTCFNRVVLLTGEARNAQYRQQAEEMARSVPDVGRIYNEITVQMPTSSFVRTSDSWITTKIKTEMLATKDLQSSTVKVVTENGSVYLMGIVNREQADMVVDIARQVAGVQRVVKIFQYK